MAYSNPIGQGLQVGRIDEGVDFSGSGPLYAMGDGVIRSVSNSGWPGGTYILLAMDDGKNVYYAENIAPSVSVGQRVKAGQQVGYARGSYPFIEVGWSTGTPGEALAAGHYTEGQATTEGKDFASVLAQFGIKVPGAAASPGGTSTPTTQVATTSTFSWSWNPIADLGNLGKFITGTTGTFSSIGDAAKAIAGLVQAINKATELFALLFRPEFWLRVGAFIFGLLALGSAAYFLKESLS